MDLDQEQGGGGLPGVLPARGEEEVGFPGQVKKIDLMILHGFLEIKTALGKMFCDGFNNGIQESGAIPFGVTAEAGLMGGVLAGEIIPGGAGAQFPEDGIQDAAGGLGRTPGTSIEVLRQERLNYDPLIVGEVHDLLKHCENSSSLVF